MIYLNPVKIIVFTAFIIFLFSFDKGRKVHLLLLGVLLLSLVNEALSTILLINKMPIKLNNSIYVAINTFLWLWILMKISGHQKIIKIGMALFFIFAVTNFIFIDGMHKFNFYTFVFGGILYIVLFIYDSTNKLAAEEFNYFSTNDYLLLTAPLSFFIGLSMLLGFENKALHNYLLVGRLNVYNLVNYCINLVCYTMIMAYIYKENKLKHVR